MEQKLTRQQSLESLKLQNFDQMTKGQVPGFLSLLPKMNPEVAGKALDTLLAIPQMATEIAKCFQETMDRSLDQNSSVTKDCNDADRAIIGALLCQLERDDISAEERKDIRDDLLEYSKRMHDTNTENKNFLDRAINTVQNHGKEIFVVAVLGIATIFWGAQQRKSTSIRQ